MNSTTPHSAAASAHVRGAATDALIALAFGILWALWGGLALSDLLGLLSVVGAVAIAGALTTAAIRLLLVTQRMPSNIPVNPFKALSYRLATLFEAIAIPVADTLLGKEHHAIFIAPVTAMIVGIHFFGQVSALKARMYLGAG